MYSKCQKIFSKNYYYANFANFVSKIEKNCIVLLSMLFCVTVKMVTVKVEIISCLFSLSYFD